MKASALYNRTLLVHTEYPFGKGSLTGDGVQYSSEVTGIDNDAFDAIETVTIVLPANCTLVEIEFGLTLAGKSSGTTDDCLWKAQASDDNSSWEDLCAQQTISASTSYADDTVAGRFAPTGNFTGNSTFYVRFVAKSGGATDTVSAKAKNSSYIRAKYRLY